MMAIPLVVMLAVADAAAFLDNEVSLELLTSNINDERIRSPSLILVPTHSLR